MGILRKLSAYQRTRGGLLIFGFAELLLAFVLSCVAISLLYAWAVLGCIVGVFAALLLFGFVQSMVRFIATLIYHTPQAKPLGKKYTMALIFCGIMLVVTLPLVYELPSLNTRFAVVLPTQYPCAGTQAFTTECLCIGPGPNFQDASLPSEESVGFPVVTAHGDPMCFPPEDPAAVRLDEGAAFIVGASTATIGVLGILSFRHRQSLRQRANNVGQKIRK